MYLVPVDLKGRCGCLRLIRYLQLLGNSVFFVALKIRSIVVFRYSNALYDITIMFTFTLFISIMPPAIIIFYAWSFSIFLCE